MSSSRGQKSQASRTTAAHPLHYSSLPLDPLVHNLPPTVFLLLHQSQHLLVPIPPERMELLRALVR